MKLFINLQTIDFFKFIINNYISYNNPQYQIKIMQ